MRTNFSPFASEAQKAGSSGHFFFFSRFLRLAVLLGIFVPLLAGAQSNYATPFFVTTWAGTAGTSGRVDGSGGLARFYAPTGEAVDSSGNLYVADTNNHTIRKMSPAGVVTTLAGTAGSFGSTDGTGSAARFYYPCGVAVDASGNVYVADRDNHTIRKITPAGVVTTLAGTAGSSGSTDGTGNGARFNAPRGVAVDASGNVYVADTNNQTIRKITPAGVVTTTAGAVGIGGSVGGVAAYARFYDPYAVAVDAAGNVYVADRDNNTIRKMTSAGIVTTLAGSAGTSGSSDGTGSAARFYLPEGLSVDGSGNVYVADTHNQTIRKITPGGVVTTLAGTAGSGGITDGVGSAARFYYPQGIAVDASGNVYVADTNHTIRIAPMVWTQPASQSVPVGASVTISSGNVVTPVPDSYQWKKNGVNISGATAPTLVLNNAQTTDSGNYTLVATNSQGSFASIPSVVTVLAFPANDGFAGATTISGGTANLSAYNYGAGKESGEPNHAGDPGGASVWWSWTAPSSGTITITTTGSTMNTLLAVYTGSAVGSLSLVASSDDISATSTASQVTFTVTPGTTYRIAVDGKAGATGYVSFKLDYAYTFLTLAGTAGSSGGTDGTGSAARFYGPSGVAVDGSGNVYVADAYNNVIRKITSAGVVTTLAGTAGSSGSTDGTGSAARFSYPFGVAVDSSGNVYVADNGNNTIRKITPAGVVTTLAGTAGSSGSTDGTGSAARFYGPYGVAVDGSGNIYVADTYSHTIRKITPAGVVTTLAGTAGSSGSADGTGSAARFASPQGVGVDSAGNIYVADTSNNTIRKVTPAGVVTTLAGTAGSTGSTDGTGSSAGFFVPSGVAVDSSGNVFVADDYNKTIRKVTSAGVVTTLAGAAGVSGSTDGTGSAARFNQPFGVATDSVGNIYVADQASHTLRKGYRTSNTHAPIFTSQPQAQTLAAGVTLTLSVGVSGNPAPTYQWKKDGVNISGATGATLMIANTVIGDGGNYTVVATNSQGSATSASALVTILPFPANDAFANASTVSGATANLSASNYGTGKEGGEPNHAGGAGGASVWWNWTAPADGTVTISTNGSAIDTLLAVYTGNAVGSLSLVASNDDISATNKASQVSFAVSTGTTYRVAVDGKAGATGNLVLGLSYPYHFVTLAGTAGGSYGTTDGTGSAARFFNPSGAAVDSNGNVYVADTYNSAIRKITPSGVVTTLAGTAGSSGSTDGTGSAAKFNNPWGVAVDGGGNVYVADSANNVIRKVTSAGVVTTLAGTAGSSGSTDGTGSAARFNFPTGVAVDGSGNVYVADSSNHVIRKVTPAGVVTTLAGTAGSNGNTDGTGSAARFYGPFGVAVDTSGNVYISDRNNKTIRKVTPAGAVTTLAGTAGSSGTTDGTGTAAQFNSPSGVAVDGSGNVYVADQNSYTIRKITPAGVVTTLGGTAGSSGSTDGIGSAALFNYPSGLAADTSGNVYVADSNNNTIRKGYLTSNTYSPIVFAQPQAQSLAAGATLTLSVGVSGNPSLTYQWKKDGGNISGATGATLAIANAQVADSGGYTVVATNSQGSVTSAAAVVSVLAVPTNDGLSGATTASGGSLYLAGNNYGASKESGEPNHAGGAGGASVWWNWTAPADGTVTVSTNGSAIDSLLAVYTGSAVGSLNLVTSNDDISATNKGSQVSFAVTSGTVYRIAVDGKAGATGYLSLSISYPYYFTTLAGLAGSTGSTDGAGSAARFNFPTGVAVDGNGNAYVADIQNHTIRKITPAGVVTTFAGTAGSSGSADGTGIAARFLNPQGVAVDASGNVYVADAGNHTIRKITPAGVVTTLAGTAGSSGSTDGNGSAARFNAPRAVAVDSSGNVYVAEPANNTIRKITPAGVVTTLAGTAGSFGSTDGTGSSARFNAPMGVAVDSTGSVYVADTSNHTIRKITPAGVVTTFAGTAGSSGSLDGIGSAAVFYYPYGVSVDASGNIYVADQNTSKIRKITPAGAVTTLAGSGSGSADGDTSVARFSYPQGVAVDSSGNVYVADSNNYTLRKGSLASNTFVPVLFAQPQGQMLGAGGVLTLSIGASGNPASYQWKKDGVNVSGGTGATLVINNAQTSDSGNYTVVATNSQGSVTSTAAAVTVFALAANDNFLSATTLSGEAANVLGQNLNASKEPGEPNHAGNVGGASIWYNWTAPFTGVANVSTSGSITTLLAVYTGSAVNSLSLVVETSAGNQDFPVIAGTTYRIAVDGKDGAMGAVSLAVRYAYTFTTFAGTSGSTGSTNGTGSAARFSSPFAAVADSAGNIYVSDTGNHVIRKITPAGVVTTFAGTAGSSGSTDGTGSAARFYNPHEVALDASGNVYVADTYNHTIRKITPAGVVTTLAGAAGSSGSTDGTGSAARFYYPTGVALDASGNVYVADTSNHTIRKITPGGVVMTLAGTALSSGSTDGTGNAARFYYPQEVAADSSGNVYVSDYYNHTIRKISSAGVVTTLAGTGGSSGSTDGTGSAARFSYPQGVAVDSSGNIYATSGNTIRKITPAGVVTTFAGLAGSSGSIDGTGNAVRFIVPSGIAWDSNGYIYVVDNSDQTIRKGVPSSGPLPPSFNIQPQTQTIAVGSTLTLTANALGSPSPTYQWRKNIVNISGATGSSLVLNNVQIADSGNFTVVATNSQGSATSSTAVVTVLALPANDSFASATAVSFSGSGTTLSAYNYLSTVESGEPLHAGFSNSHSVWWAWTAPASGAVIIDTFGSTFDTVLGVYTGSAVGSLTGVASNDDATTSSTGASKVSFVATAGTTYKIAVDGKYGALGNINLNVNYAFSFSVFAGLTGTGGSTDGTGSAARFNSPYGVAADSSGNVYVADGNAIRKITSAGVVTTLAGVSGSSGSTDGTGSAARFYGPNGVAVDGSGNVYVADTYNYIIRKITPAGVVTTLAGSAGNRGSTDGTGSAARFDTPNGVAVDSSGNVYVADCFNYTIRKITPAGVVTTLAGTAGSYGSTDGTGSAARFSNPNGVTVDASGNVYVPDGANLIRRITSAGVVTTLAGAAASIGSMDGTGSAAQFNYPTGIAVDGAGNVYVAEHENFTIRRVTAAGVVTTIGGTAGTYGSADGVAAAASFKRLNGVAINSAGILYVADTSNNTIRRGIPTNSPFAPSFSVSPQSQTAIVGDTVTFTPTALGYPAPTYQWKKNGGNISGATGATLTLSNVQLADAGNYTITATNSQGSATSNAAVLTVLVPAANDALAGATSLSGNSTSVTGYNFGAGKEAGELGHAGNAGGHSVWWAWTAPASGTVSVDTMGSDFDTLLAVYTGSSIGTLSAVAQNDNNTNDATGIASRVSFVVTAGTTYRIAVDGKSGAVGNIHLSLGYEYAFITAAGSPHQSGTADGTGSAARFAGPASAATDSAGNIYIADADNHVIRKVTPAGVVTTLAGSAGISGTADGTGSAARFNIPFGVAVDSSGNVYVADSGNHSIRKVTAAGVVTSLAGSSGNSGNTNATGAAARFNSPYALTVDANGNVYVADSNNHLIRKVTSAGVVTTLAGTAGTAGSTDGTGTAAQFNYPDGIAVDAVGNVYVADTYNSTIRKITSAGVVMTLAGAAGSSGSVDGPWALARFALPYGISLDSSGNIYVADRTNRNIRKVSTDGVVRTLGGLVGSTGSAEGIGTQGQFEWPWSATIDSTGNIYIADYNAVTLRKGVLSNNPIYPVASITPASSKVAVGGSVTLTSAVLGNPVPTLQWSKDGVAISGVTGGSLALSNVVLGDTGNYTVTATNSMGNRTSSPAAVSVVELPGNDAFANAIDATTSGLSWTSSFYNYGATKEANEPNHAGNSGGASAWFSYTALASGMVVVDTLGSNFDTVLAVYTGSSPGTLGYVASDDESGGNHTSRLSFNAVAGTKYSIAIDGFGGATGDYALHLNYAYTFSTLAGLAGTSGTSDGSGGAGRFNTPSGVAVDGSGNMYVADSLNHAIRKITPAGVVTTFAGLAGSSGTAPGTGSAARFNRPSAICIDSAGNLYVADTLNHAIRKITSGAVVTTLAGTPGSSGTADGTGSAARFNSPAGIAVDSAGNVYVSDTASHTIRKVTPAGVVTTLAGSAGLAGAIDGTGAAARFSNPKGLAASASGYIYVADYGNNLLRAIAPSGLVYSFGGTAGIAGSSDGSGSQALFNKPTAVALDGNGQIYITEEGNNTIRKFNNIGTPPTFSTIGGLGGVVGSTDGVDTASRFNGVSGIAIDASGLLFITDTLNHTVRKGTIPVIPRITSSASVTATFGQSVSYSITAANSPTSYGATGLPAGLTINSVTGLISGIPSQLGSFSVIISATNGDGTGSATLSLTVNAITPIVATPTSGSITATTATVGGNVTSDGGATVIARGVVYAPTATNSNPQIGGAGVTNVTGTGTTGIFTVNASSLAPGTAYTFAAYATNSLGTSYSDAGSFTTPVALSTNADLSNLVLSVGTLAPPFSSGNTSYTASVSNATTGVTVTPTALQGNATIKVNGVTVSSGSASGNLALSVGLNTITTVVTAQDGVTTKTYTVTVTRQTATESFRQTWYGTSSNTGNGADNADPLHTGVPNLAVYAFFGPGQNPATAQASQLPQAQFSGGNLAFNFIEPAGVSGITYGAESSTSLSSGAWQAIPDTGSGTHHIFSAPVGSKLFMRLKVTSP